MMESNFKEIVQTILYLGGIVYFFVDGLRKFKLYGFECAINKCYFLCGIFGGTSVLLLIAYMGYCLEFSPVSGEICFFFLCYASVVFPLSGYLYFLGLTEEAKFKQTIYMIELPIEYVSWKKKKWFFIVSGIIMDIIVLVGLYNVYIMGEPIPFSYHDVKT